MRRKLAGKLNAAIPSPSDAIQQPELVLEGAYKVHLGRPHDNHGLSTALFDRALGRLAYDLTNLDRGLPELEPTLQDCQHVRQLVVLLLAAHTMDNEDQSTPLWDPWKDLIAQTQNRNPSRSLACILPARCRCGRSRIATLRLGVQEGVRSQRGCVPAGRCGLYEDCDTSSGPYTYTGASLCLALTSVACRWRRSLRGQTFRRLYSLSWATMSRSQERSMQMART